MCFEERVTHCRPSSWASASRAGGLDYLDWAVSAPRSVFESRWLNIGFYSCSWAHDPDKAEYEMARITAESVLSVCWQNWAEFKHCWTTYITLVAHSDSPRSCLHLALTCILGDQATSRQLQVHQFTPATGMSLEWPLVMESHLLAPYAKTNEKICICKDDIWRKRQKWVLRAARNENTKSKSKPYRLGYLMLLFNMSPSARKCVCTSAYTKSVSWVHSS